VFSSITNESDLLIMHPSGLGVNSSVLNEKSQLKYLETQSSCGTPNGFSSFENNSTPYTLCSPGNAKKIEKSKNGIRIQVDPLNFLIVQSVLLVIIDLIRMISVAIIIFDNLN
jgi:hypothetical protein